MRVTGYVSYVNVFYVLWSIVEVKGWGSLGSVSKVWWKEILRRIYLVFQEACGGWSGESDNLMVYS